MAEQEMQPMKASMRFWHTFGTQVVLEQMRIKVKPRKCLTCKALQSEAEGTRTLNLRIDSPML